MLTIYILGIIIYVEVTLYVITCSFISITSETVFLWDPCDGVLSSDVLEGEEGPEPLLQRSPKTICLKSNHFKII